MEDIDFETSFESLLDKRDEKALLVFLVNNLDYLKHTFVNKDNILHKAVRANLPILFYYVITRCADLTLLDQINDERRSPIELAIALVRIEIVAIVKMFLSSCDISKEASEISKRLEYILSYKIFTEESIKKVNALLDNKDELRKKCEDKLHSYLNEQGVFSYLFNSINTLFGKWSYFRTSTSRQQDETSFLIKKQK